MIATEPMDPSHYFTRAQKESAAEAAAKEAETTKLAESLPVEIEKELQTSAISAAAAKIAAASLAETATTAAANKLTRVTVIMNPDKLYPLQEALEMIGITGMTVTNVSGYGIQKGHGASFRGAPIDTRLMPKVKIDVVVSKIPVETVVETIETVLHTGQIGDGKIFIYDVDNVIKVRTGEQGYDALQDVYPLEETE